jgi:hypothetical protein
VVTSGGPTANKASGTAPSCCDRRRSACAIMIVNCYLAHLGSGSDLKLYRWPNNIMGAILLSSHCRIAPISPNANADADGN